MKAANARIQQAPSSRVALDLQDGYVPARQFTGFVNEAAGVSLVIVELPDAAYEQLANGLTPEALATKGIANAEAAKLTRADPYLYMRGVQKSDQGAIAKFMVAFRDGGVTALVTANVQQASIERGDVKAGDIEQLLASAAIAPSAAPPKDVFRLGYTGPFKPAGSILGNTRVFTLDGKMGPAGASGDLGPLLIVAPSLDLRKVEDSEKLAQRLLSGLPGVDTPRVEESRSLRIAGMTAVELIGVARDKSSGAERVVWQTLIVSEAGGYFRLVGQLPVAEKEQLLPELRKIADAFSPVE